MSKLVMASDWQNLKGKWHCNLVCYDGEFNCIPLLPGLDISFRIQGGRHCIGYTAFSNRDIHETYLSDPWRKLNPCPQKAKISKGLRCPSCSSLDALRHCLICDGTECMADPVTRRVCETSTACVYLASFGLENVKVGVSLANRIIKRWIEQGADMAKRILMGNGMEVRRFEKKIQDELRVRGVVKASQKVGTLWKAQNMERARQLLNRIEEKVMGIFPVSHQYHEPPKILTEEYNLPSFNRRPLELRVKDDLQIKGKILGVKGPLLLIERRNSIYFLKINQLIGRKIIPYEISFTKIQTNLEQFYKKNF